MLEYMTNWHRQISKISYCYEITDTHFGHSGDSMEGIELYRSYNLA